MSLECIKDREIFGCYISDRTCDLTFTVETGGLRAVGLIINCALIDIVVINDFISVAAYNDQTVCRKIITCIFRYKFRIYYRILLLYFNMLGFIFIFLKQIGNILIFRTALCNLVNCYVLVQIFQHCFCIITNTVEFLAADINF